MYRTFRPVNASRNSLGMARSPQPMYWPFRFIARIMTPCQPRSAKFFLGQRRSAVKGGAAAEGVTLTEVEAGLSWPKPDGVSEPCSALAGVPFRGGFEATADHFRIRGLIWLP